MRIPEHIDFDVQSLKGYFLQLFSMAEQASKIPPPIDKKSLAHQFIAEDVAAFIRPDMTSNTYHLLDFWLAKLCNHYRKKFQLELTHQEIRGQNGLDTYHKYLTKVALLDLSSVTPSLQRLHALRKVRNCFVHGGGHVSEERQTELTKLEGIIVVGSLITVSDDFIWASLEHVRTYLLGVAKSRSRAMRDDNAMNR